MSGLSRNSAPAGVDWDAARYDRVSDPQVEWGRRVITRLAPQPHERILDVGCGTGRLTGELAARVPRGSVVGLDRSAAMLAVAQPALADAGRARGSGGVRFVRGDGAALPFASAFDAVFSAATLHWIGDHDSVFRSVFHALRPGGRFVAQCGGGRNLERLYTRAARLMGDREFAPFFGGWRDPWHFASPDATRDALIRAGFRDVSASLEAAPVTFGGEAAFAEFVACVCLRHHLDRVPADRRAPFVSRITRDAEGDDPALTLDYWRLNIDARRPPA